MTMEELETKLQEKIAKGDITVEGGRTRISGFRKSGTSVLRTGILKE